VSFTPKIYQNEILTIDRKRNNLFVDCKRAWVGYCFEFKIFTENVN